MLPGPQNVAIHKGLEPKCLVYLVFDGNTKWSSLDSYRFETFGNIMERILTDKLREDMHQVYGFGLNAEIARFPHGKYNFSMTIPCDPKNADTLVRAVLNEIRRIQEKGITDIELQKEKENQRISLEKNMQDNTWWLYYLENAFEVELNPSLIDHPYAYLNNLKAGDIQKAAIKYIATEKMERFTLYPENYIDK